MALTDQLTAIGNAIRYKTGGSALIPLSDMPTEILGIGGGISPSSADLTLTGDMSNAFLNGRFKWIFDLYPTIVSSSGITNAASMFKSYTGTFIPIDINLTNASMTSMFTDSSITESPTLSGTASSVCNSIYDGCNNLRTIPENVVNNLTVTSSTNNRQSMFRSCYSLKHIPNLMITKLINTGGNTNGNYSGTFQLCYALDSINNLSVNIGTTTKNLFSSNTFTNCSRLSSFTFETDNGTPYSRTWSNQAIVLTSYIGYGSASNITGYNSGLTSATQITDATSYAALKNNPDSWTADITYSRYNHDSAVATINSLPDVSAGSSNTISFKGAAGSATDGGAISTLTTAEIAVATAKGWTVTLV